MPEAISTDAHFVSAPRDSLPDNLAAVFNSFTSETEPGRPPAIKTSEEWTELLSAITAAGLLPQPDLLRASHELALPATLAALQKRLNSAHEPPRAQTIDGLLDGSVARVRHLHGLLAEWELSTLSAEHSARLLAMIEALKTRLSASILQLRMWHDGIHAALGPERCQSLFWDLLDPVASHPESPHAFQRDQLIVIEQRCAKNKLSNRPLLPKDQAFSSTTYPVSAGAAFGSSQAVYPRPDSNTGMGFGAWSAAKSPAEHGNSDRADFLPSGVEVGIGQSDGKKVRVIRCPHSGVGWAETSKLMAWVDATRQLALSRHAPAFLGHEPCVGADGSGYPPHARWHMELIQGTTLHEGLLEGGGLAETSLLFRHWRREIIEGLYHLSCMTTFLLPHSITLKHCFAADEGCRLVFDHLQWGAEFPEPSSPNPPDPLHQSLALPTSLARSKGVDGSFDGAEAYQPPKQEPQPVGHHALRDTLLLYDAVAMLTSLLTGEPQETTDDGTEPAALPPTDTSRSAYLSAILDACGHPTSPPTLKQLLSHPYFAPVDGFEREDVRAAYRRWRSKGLV